MFSASKEGKGSLTESLKTFKESLGEENVAGTIENLIEASDVIIDCS